MLKLLNPRVGPFLTQGSHLNNLGRGLLDKPNSVALGLMVSHKKIFQDFYYILSLCKTSDPRVGAISDPRAKI